MTVIAPLLLPSKLWTCWRKCWCWTLTSGSRHLKLWPTPTSPSTTIQMTSLKLIRTTKALRAGSWRLRNGKVSWWGILFRGYRLKNGRNLERNTLIQHYIIKVTQKWCDLTLSTSWCLTGLTYEEVLSFVPPSFDGEEMESWGGGAASSIICFSRDTFERDEFILFSATCLHEYSSQNRDIQVPAAIHLWRAWRHQG